MELWDEIMTEQALLDRAVQELKPRGRKRPKRSASTEWRYLKDLPSSAPRGSQ